MSQSRYKREKDTLKATSFGKEVRNTRGSGLVEGMLGLVLIIGGIVCGTILLVNVGIATYYKEKLGFISNQAANYAASLDPKENISDKTKDFVKELMPKMGFANSGLEVTTALSTVAGKQAATVTVASSELPLFGRGSILPLTLSLKDSATAVKGLGGLG
ncbi:MAG: hypothetical protein HY711_00400, partial [Candidatus Melainabacteria bacterium]|nr:hypothetical protein [Candidatus Melainabacteria bacterium]